MKSLLVLAVLCAPNAAVAQTLTAKEAQELSVADLAARALGLAGTVVVDVQRPARPSCVGVCPPATPHPAGPPPLDAITFYTRATATSETGWAGLCQAYQIVVRFDAQGRATSLDQTLTTGSAERLMRVANDRTAMAAQNAQAEATCRALPTTRSFFIGDGMIVSRRAAIAVEMVHDAMASGGPIKVGCIFNNFGNPLGCATRREQRDLAERVVTARITGVEPAFQSGALSTVGAVERACYSVRLDQPFHLSEQLDVCVVASFDKLTVIKAGFSRSRVVY